MSQTDPSPPKVLVFSGHLTDAPARPSPRFPESLVPAVERRIATALERWRFGPGDLAIGGGARGADTLVAEACLRRGVDVKRMLSHPAAEFVEKSVRGGDPSWESRFRTLDARYGHLELGKRDAAESDDPYERTNVWMLRTAESEAAPGRLYALVVWDEQPAGDGPGGTSHFVSELNRLHAQIEIVNPHHV